MAKISGRAIGTNICKMVGLDPHDVSTIDIHIAPNDAVTMTVKVFADEKVVEYIISELETTKAEVLDGKSNQ